MPSQYSFEQQLTDLQEALRTLWPDRPVVYFTAKAAEEAEKGPGVLLSEDEQATLHRVARAFGARREAPVHAVLALPEVAALRAKADGYDRVRELVDEYESTGFALDRSVANTIRHALDGSQTTVSPPSPLGWEPGWEPG